MSDTNDLQELAARFIEEYGAAGAVDELKKRAAAAGRGRDKARAEQWRNVLFAVEGQVNEQRRKPREK